MPVSGFPVVIVESGGLPVTQVESRAPLMTVATNGRGIPVTLTDNAAPFIIQGAEMNLLFALSSDDGGNLTDDDDETVETY